MFSTSHFRETKLLLFFTVLIVLAFACLPLFADSVGFTYNQIDTDSGWGVTADKSFQVGSVGLEADGQLQSGDLYRGKYHAEVNFPLFSRVKGKFFTGGYVKGSTLKGLGNVNDFGTAFEFPAIGAVTWGFGIFARATGPFSKQSAIDVLVPVGFNEGYLESLGLQNVYADPTGLSIQDFNSWNALFYGEFDWRNWHVKVSGLPQLTRSDNPVHQLLAEFSTSVEVAGNFDVDFALDLGFQTYNKTIEHEQAFLVTLGYNFN